MCVSVPTYLHVAIAEMAGILCCSTHICHVVYSYPALSGAT